jgi:hypothetical protein
MDVYCRAGLLAPELPITNRNFYIIVFGFRCQKDTEHRKQMTKGRVFLISVIGYLTSDTRHPTPKAGIPPLS